MPGGHINLMQFVEVLHEHFPYIQVGQFQGKIILTGQHSQVKKRNRKKPFSKKRVLGVI